MAAESLISITVKDSHMANLQTSYLVCLPQAITYSIQCPNEIPSTIWLAVSKFLKFFF